MASTRGRRSGKRILTISNAKDAPITPKGGFEHFGDLKTDYALVRGSVPGSNRRVLVVEAPDEAASKGQDRTGAGHIARRWQEGSGDSGRDSSRDSSRGTNGKRAQDRRGSASGVPARGTVNVIDMSGKPGDEVAIPSVFSTPLRPDIVSRGPGGY